MSPTSPSAMEEESAGERLMEARVDDAVMEPFYNVATLPGQGALLAPTVLSAPCTSGSPTTFQAPGDLLDSAARVSGETHSGSGSRNGSNGLPLTTPSLRERDVGGKPADRADSPGAEMLRTPRSQFARLSPSLSSMERGRPSVRSRAAVTRESSIGDPRMDQLAFLMESMMNRMDRLEGSERSSRRSGATSHSRSFREYRGSRPQEMFGEVEIGPHQIRSHPRVPVFPQGPCMHHQVQSGQAGLFTQASSSCMPIRCSQVSQVRPVPSLRCRPPARSIRCSS